MIELASSLFEGQTGRLVFRRLPADTNTEIEAPAGQHIDRCCCLGKNDRPPESSQQNVGTEPDPRGASREVGNHGERLEPVTVGTGRLPTAGDTPECRVGVRIQASAKRDVVRDSEPIDAGGISRFSSRREMAPPVRGIRRERDEGQRQLWWMSHTRSSPVLDDRRKLSAAPSPPAGTGGLTTGRHDRRFVLNLRYR